MADHLAILREKGYIENKDGSLSHRSRADAPNLGAMAPQKPSKPQQPLDEKHERHPRKQRAVRQVGAPKAKSTTRVGRCGSPCEVSITFIACSPRPIDTDNLAGGFKPLRDAVAQWLGIDDGNPGLRWEYHQADTRHVSGTIILIQVHDHESIEDPEDEKRTGSSPCERLEAGLP